MRMQPSFRGFCHRGISVPCCETDRRTVGQNTHGRPRRMLLSEGTLDDQQFLNNTPRVKRAKRSQRSITRRGAC